MAITFTGNTGIAAAAGDPVPQEHIFANVTTDPATSYCGISMTAAGRVRLQDWNKLPVLDTPVTRLRGRPSTESQVSPLGPVPPIVNGSPWPCPKCKPAIDAWFAGAATYP